MPPSPTLLSGKTARHENVTAAGETLVLSLGLLAVSIVATVLVFRLALLLIVNHKATAVLKQNGVRVGFMGANPSEI